MSARDDYPNLAAFARGSSGRDADLVNKRREADRALDEIALLRADVSNLLSKLAQAELKLRIAADPNASLWTPA